MTDRIRLIAAVALLAAPPLSAQDHPTLSLADALTLAKAHNPTFLGQRNDVSVAAWQVRSAYADFLPTLNASNSLGYIAPGERRSGSVVLGEQPSIISSSYSLGLSYSITAARLRQPRTAKAELELARERVASAGTTLVNDITRYYLSALQSQQTMAQAEREVARTDGHLRLARARFAAGATSSIDVKRAEIQSSQAELKRLRAENQARVDLLALGRAMGVLLPLGTRLTSTFELAEPAWTADSLVALALRHGAAIAVNRAAEQMARARLSAAQGHQLPSLNFNMNYNGWVQSVGSIEAGVRQRLGSNPDSVAAARVRAELLQTRQGFPFNYNKQPISASMTISIPLFQGLSRSAQLRSSRAALQDASYQLVAEELRVRVEVTSATLNLQSAYRAAVLQRDIREKAAEELRLAEDRVRYGGSSSLVITEAQTQLAQAEVDEIQAVYDFHKQLAALETLVGVSLRQPPITRTGVAR